MPLFRTLLRTLFRTSFRTSFLVLAAAAICPVAAHAAQPVYKCRVDGKPSYSDRPCAGGGGQTLAAPALPGSGAGIPVGDTAGVATGDSRTLLDLEQVRTERARQEAIEAREARARARAGRVQIKQVQHCDKLHLQHKWLEEDLAKANTPARQNAAQTRLRRQAETMAVECPA
jgi:hypothetical protein